MFDRDFFSVEFREKARKFSAEHNAQPIRVVFFSVFGHEFDLMRYTASDIGLTLYTRSEEMVFLRFEHLATIAVSIAVERGTPGFQTDE
jgi:hypothetical protein